MFINYMAKNSLTNTQIYALIFLVFYSFLKSITHFIIVLNSFGLSGKTLEYYKSLELINADIWNTFFIIFSLYLIFVKSVRSVVYFTVCILLLFKGLLHFITDYKIYRYLKFDKNTQDKIENFHTKFANITDLLIGMVSLFLLIKIFMG